MSSSVEPQRVTPHLPVKATCLGLDRRLTGAQSGRAGHVPQASPPETATPAGGLLPMQHWLGACCDKRAQGQQ